MDARSGLRDFLKMETFWIRNYLAREVKSELHGAVQVVLLLGVLNIVVAFAIPMLSGYPDSHLVIYTLISAFVGVFVVGVITASMFRIPRDSGRAEFEDVSCSPKRLPSDTRDLFRVMGCSRSAKLLYESRTGSFVPSVFRDASGTYAIVIPGGLAARPREERRALLAHEIAHVDHDDIELWLASDRISRGLRWASIAMLALLGVSILALPGFGGAISSHIYTYVRMLLSFYRLRSKVKTFRRYSETRADFAAIAYTSGAGLHGALTAIAEASPGEISGETGDDDHPPMAERLALVDDATRYWSGQFIGRGFFEKQPSGEGSARTASQIQNPVVRTPSLPRSATPPPLSQTAASTAVTAAAARP